MQAAWNQWANSTMTTGTMPAGMAATPMTPYGAPAPQAGVQPAAAAQNYQYYGGAANAAAAPAAAAPTTAAMPTLPTYTAEQWALLTPEQQSWHMAQWHQQQAYYTQWQQMAAAQAQAAQAAAVAPPLPPTSQAAPPPLPEEKKRPAEQTSADTAASKKAKTEDKAAAPGAKPETLEDLLELRKSFDTQFSNWENEYFKWKEANANHPDQAQKREYEAKWSQWREQLLHKRDVIDKKITDKRKSVEEEERKKEEERGKAASAWSNAYNALSSAPTTNWLGAQTGPPPGANNAPLQFMNRTTGGVSQIPGLGDSKSDAAKGGPGSSQPGDKPLDNTKPLWTSDNAPFNFPTPAAAAPATPAAAGVPPGNPYAQSYPGMPGATGGFPGMPAGYGMMMQNPAAGYNPMMPYQYPGMMTPQYPGAVPGSTPAAPGTPNQPTGQQPGYPQFNQQAPGNQPGPGPYPGAGGPPGQNTHYQGPNTQGGPNSQYQGGANSQYPGGPNSQFPPGPNSQFSGGPGGPNSQYPGGQNQNMSGPPPNMGVPPPGAPRKSRFSEATEQNEFGAPGEANARPGPGMGGPQRDNSSGPYGNNRGGPHGDSASDPYGNNRGGPHGDNASGPYGNNMGGPRGNSNLGPPGGRNSFGNAAPPQSRYVDKYAKKYEEDDETEFENYHQRFAAEDGAEEEWRGPGGGNGPDRFNKGGQDFGFGSRDKFGGGSDGFGGNRNSFGNNRDNFGNNRDNFGNNRDSFGSDRNNFDNRDSSRNSQDKFGNNSEGFGNRNNNFGAKNGGNDFGLGTGARNSFGSRDNSFSGGRGDGFGGPGNSGPPARDFSGRDSFGPNKGPRGPSRFTPMEEDQFGGPAPPGPPGMKGAPPPSKTRWGAANEVENQPPKKPVPPDPTSLDTKPRTCIVVEYNHRKVPAAMSIELIKGYNEPYKGPIHVFEYSHGANKKEFFRQRAASPSHPSRRRSPLREKFTSPTLTPREGRLTAHTNLHPALRGSDPCWNTRDASSPDKWTDRRAARDKRSPDRQPGRWGDRDALSPQRRADRERVSPDRRLDRERRSAERRLDRRSPDRRLDRERLSPERRVDRLSPERRPTRERPSPDRRLDRERRTDRPAERRFERDRRSPDHRGRGGRDQGREQRSPEVIDVEARLSDLEERLAEQRRILAEKARNMEQKKIAIEDLLEPPARESRPGRIVIFLRGPPCSGKSFLAKIIKDKESQYGGAQNMRILSLDDYFMTNEVEREIKDERGFTKKIKAFEYEYEKELEDTYRTNLVKSFKKNINDAYFSFVIVDACNDKLSHYAEMYVHAKSKGFAVYIAETTRDVAFCTTNNVHARSEADIQAIVNGFEATPKEQVLLDTTSLLQSAEIEDVEMEDVENNGEMDDVAVVLPGETDDVLSGLSEEDDDVMEIGDASSFTIPSKWDNIDHSIGEIKAKLDGLCRKPARSLREWLHGDDGGEEQLSIYNSSRQERGKGGGEGEEEGKGEGGKGEGGKGGKGKKRVRWADIEEKFEQDKMKAIGFIVGGTDWNRMMDPESGTNRLNQTKYI